MKTNYNPTRKPWTDRIFDVFFFLLGLHGVGLIVLVDFACIGKIVQIVQAAAKVAA